MARFIMLTVLLLWTGLSVHGQEVETLIKKGVEIRGFGGLDLGITSFKDQSNLMVGGHGGVIFNKRFIVGAGGKGLVTNSSFQGIEPDENLYLYGGYGGLMLGYIFKPVSVVHLSFPVLIGGGGFTITDQPITQNINLFAVETGSFFVVEPGIEVELNVARFFRIALGGSYRFIPSLEMDNLSESDVSGASMNIAFRFGKF